MPPKKSAKKPARRKPSSPAKAGAVKLDPATGKLQLGTDKLYFKIGEVAEIVGVAAHVLRYWETEFPQIKPQKSRSQQRVYRRKDVENLLRIKHLLYGRKFTIAGARQELRGGVTQIERAEVSGLYKARRSLEAVREQLDLLALTVRAEDELSTQLDADPARFVQEAGGARGLLDKVDGGGPQQTLLERPDRKPR